MSTERIQIVVSQSGAQNVGRDIAGIGKGADSAAKSIGGLGKAIVAVAAGAAVREVIALADSYTTMGNRLKFATGSTREAARVQEQLFGSARRTGASVTDLTEVYSRLTVSTKNLGLSQGEVLTMTEDLQKATQLSGATSQEAANALRQLGQGLGAGALRGDELNSILENTPLIAQLIADSMGKPIGMIRQLGSEGKITGQVIVKAMKDAHDVLTVKFGESLRTVDGSMNALRNAAVKVAGAINEATGASIGLSDAFVKIGGELEAMAPELGEIARILADYVPFQGIFDRIFGSTTMTDWIEAFSVTLALLEDGIKVLTFTAEEGKSAAKEVLEAIAAARNARADAEAERASRPRVGVTIVEHAGRGKAAATGTPTGKFKRDKSFEAEISLLERQNELLRMGDQMLAAGKDEKELQERFDAAILAIHAKVTPLQRQMLDMQLRKNHALEIEQRLESESNDRISERLAMELEIMAAEDKRFTREASEEVSKGMAAAARRGQLGDQSVGAQFGRTTEFMAQEQLDRLEGAGVTLAHIFGPGGTLEQGLGNVGSSMADLIGHSIAFGESWGDTEQAIKRLGQTILAEVISALIQTGVQMAINAALSHTLRVGETAATVAQAAAVGAAWAPAAAAASLATLGTNAVGASAALVQTNALAQTLAIPGFAEGGFTGMGAANDVAGLVHGREFVVNAEATARNRALLESINAGGTPRSGGMQVTVINQAGGVAHEVSQIDEGHIEIVARRILAREGPGVIADDMMSPHGKTGRAMVATTTAQRRRS